MSKLEHAEGRMPGLLTHFKAAAVAAALIPLTSFVAPAAAQDCPGGTITGFVWYDLNNNGIQDSGEVGIDGAAIVVTGEGFTGIMTGTDATGHYTICLPADAPALVDIKAIVPEGFTAPSAGNQGSNDAIDSDADGFDEGDAEAVPAIPAGSFATVPPGSDVDFGFYKPASVPYPGTGTPGYWKNHPEAWPVQSITIGGHSFTKAQAIGYLNDSGSDKWVTMFSSLLSAKLNVLMLNPSSCVDGTISDADAWMALFPVPGKVKASSAAWRIGEPLHRTMDNYNNGMLCAPHRD